MNCIRCHKNLFFVFGEKILAFKCANCSEELRQIAVVIES